MIAEAVFAVEPVGATERAFQRMAGAGKNGNVGAAEFGGIERVAQGLRQRDVAGDNGDGGDANVGRASAMMMATASSEPVSVSMRNVRGMVAWASALRS